MKHSILLMLFLFLLGSCKKEGVNNGQPIVGSWELRTAISGMTGVQTNYAPGNGNTLEFGKITYHTFNASQLVKSGTYKIIKDTSRINQQIFDRIVYDNELNTANSFFKIEGSSMTIWIDGYDAPAIIYERKQ